jgi:hypothetical protein
LLLSHRIGSLHAGLTVNADGQVTPGDQKNPDFQSKAGAGRQTWAGWHGSIRAEGLPDDSRQVSEAARCGPKSRKTAREAGSAARTAGAAASAASQAYVP